MRKLQEKDDSELWIPAEPGYRYSPYFVIIPIEITRILNTSYGENSSQIDQPLQVVKGERKEFFTSQIFIEIAVNLGSISDQDDLRKDRNSFQNDECLQFEAEESTNSEPSFDLFEDLASMNQEIIFSDESYPEISLPTRPFREFHFPQLHINT